MIWLSLILIKKKSGKSGTFCSKQIHFQYELEFVYYLQHNILSRLISLIDEYSEIQHKQKFNFFVV